MSGCERSKAKRFTNCVNKPLIYSSDNDPDIPMLLKAPPPANHLKLGINHFLKELAKVWPGILDWLADLNIMLEPYHGTKP